MEEAQHLADRVVVLAKGRDHRRGHAGRRSAATTRPRSSASAMPAVPRDAPAARRRGRRPRARAASAPPTPTRDLAPLLAWAAARGMELERPDRHPPDPRGRLPRSHRGGPHDRSPTSPCWPAGSRPRAHDAAQPARARLHLRLPADPDRAVQRAERQRARSTPTASDIRFAQFYTPAIAHLQPRRRVLHVAGAGHRDRARPGLLKRVRGTPLPMGIYLASWLVGAAADRDRARSCCCSSSRSPRSA